LARCSIVVVAAATVILLVASGAAAGVPQSAAIETAISARAIQPGEVVKLDVTCGCDAVSATAAVFGRDVPLFRMPEPGAWRALIGVDVETAPGSYVVAVTVFQERQPSLTATRELPVVAKEFPTRRLTVAAAFVNPPAAELARIQDEAQRLQALFEVVTARAWQGPFRAPVAAKPSGSFGSRSVFNGQARNPHGGTDFPSPAGTRILAPAAGTIALAEPLFFTGNTVVIDHGLGLYSLLAHLSRLDVEAGDHVEAGGIVGLVGATGRVTGAHLHWTVRLNGARVDPLALIAMTGTD
jgi:murein DD-endopeptidase MepM/ murein hydrolase activator NlpD